MRMEETARHDRRFIAITWFCVSAAVAIGTRARIIGTGTTMITKGYPFSLVEEDGATVTIPPLFIKIDKTD